LSLRADPSLRHGSATDVLKYQDICCRPKVSLRPRRGPRAPDPAGQRRAWPL